MIAPLLAATPSRLPTLSAPLGGQTDPLPAPDFLDRVIASYTAASLPNRPAPAVPTALPLGETLPATSPTGADGAQAVTADGRSGVLGNIVPAGIGAPPPSKPAPLVVLPDDGQMPAASAAPADSAPPALATGVAHASRPAPDTRGKLPLPRQAAPAANPKERPSATAIPLETGSTTNSPGEVLPTTSPGTPAPPDTLGTPRPSVPVPNQDEPSPTTPQAPASTLQESRRQESKPQGSTTRGSTTWGSTTRGSTTRGSTTRGSASHGARPLTRPATSGSSKSTLPGSPPTTDAAVPIAPQPHGPPELTPAPKTPSPATSLTSGDTRDGTARDETAAVRKPSTDTPPARQLDPPDGEAAAALTVPSGSPRPLPSPTADAAVPAPVHPAATGQLPLSTQPMAASTAMPSATPLPTHPAQQPAAAPQPSPGDLASRDTAAAQVAPALVHVATATNGASHVTVKLTPVELGEVRIHIERPNDGPVQVTVEATRPETLRLLRQDEPALHRALDQAGLPSEGRTVVLQQAPDGPLLDPGSARRDTMSSGQSSTGNGQGGRDSSQGWQQPGDAEETQDLSSPHRSSWMRAGINITA